MNWKDRVRDWLAARPELANVGMPQHTPLHEAVLRNDAELARVLLNAGPDLSIEDPNYHGTPLGWARHLGRGDLAALLTQHGGV